MRKGKLLGKMAESGVTQRDLARHLNISENTMTSRLRGDSEFRADEIASICILLGITDPKEMNDIFLT